MLREAWRFLGYRGKVTREVVERFERGRGKLTRGIGD